MTMGLDMPVIVGFFQATFSPLSGSQDSGSPVSRDTPFCSGPRQLDHSLAIAALCDGAAGTSARFLGMTFGVLSHPMPAATRRARAASANFRFMNVLCILSCLCLILV